MVNKSHGTTMGHCRASGIQVHRVQAAVRGMTREPQVRPCRVVAASHRTRKEPVATGVGAEKAVTMSVTTQPCERDYVTVYECKIATMDSVPRPMVGVRPPPLPFCHLCGRQFGTTSLLIHQKACAKRYEREHGSPAPEPPRSAPVGAELNSREWKAFNTAANTQFEETVMQPCPHCQRTFLPDRLEIHLRTCGKGHFANPKPRRKSCGDGEDEGSATARAGSVATHLGAAARGEQLESRTPRRSASPPPPNARLVPCPHCSRTFMPAALEIHMKSCKPASPAKPGRSTPESAHGGARSARGTPLTARGAGDDFLAWARSESRRQLEMAHAEKNGEKDGPELGDRLGGSTARSSTQGGSSDDSGPESAKPSRARSPRSPRLEGGARASTRGFGGTRAAAPGSPRCSPRGAPSACGAERAGGSIKDPSRSHHGSIKERSATGSQQAWQPPANATCRSPCAARLSSPTLYRWEVLLPVDDCSCPLASSDAYPPAFLRTI